MPATRSSRPPSSTRPGTPASPTDRPGPPSPSRYSPPKVDVVVPQPGQAQVRRADVRVVRPRRTVLPDIAHAGSDHAEPGRSDLGLDAPVVPGERGGCGRHGHARRGAVRPAGEQEV